MSREKSIYRFFKSIVKVVIISLTFFFLFSFEVSAEDFKAGDVISVKHINPIYEGIYSEKDLSDLASLDSFKALYESRQKNLNQGYQLYSSAYSSIEDAAVYMRSRMVARDEEIELYCDVDTLDVENVVNSIFYKALEHTGNGKEGDYIKYNYSGFDAIISYAVIGERYRLRIVYAMSYLTNSAQEDEIDVAVQNLLNNLEVTGKSKYERICLIYDYITENVSYDFDGLNDPDNRLKFSAYAALINKKAVCQGYASLLYRLLLDSNVDCRVISGIGNGGSHGWNIIYYNGKYYNADSTWDSEYDSHDWFMLSDDNFSLHERDEEFLTEEFYAKYPMSPADLDINSVNDVNPLRGDLNDDGIVNMLDSIYLARALARWPGYSIGTSSVFDTNMDGTINSIDSIYLARTLAKWPGYSLADFD